MCRVCLCVVYTCLIHVSRLYAYFGRRGICDLWWLWEGVISGLLCMKLFGEQVGRIRVLLRGCNMRVCGIG